MKKGAKGVRVPGFFQTLIEFPLFIDGLPFLLPLPSYGLHVKGEVYEVTNDGLDMLDHLEGHPEGYTRRTIVVHPIGDDRRQSNAWTYFYEDPMLCRLFVLGKIKAHSWYTDTKQPEPS